MSKNQDISENHLYTQKLITSHFNGFSYNEIDYLVKELRKRGFPPPLLAEIRNAFGLFNSCIRNQYLFDLFIELFPFMVSYYNGLKYYIREYDELSLEKKDRLLWRYAENARESINYIEKAVVCRMESGYLRNEMMDSNAFYKGGCQDLLSILNGLNNVILRLANYIGERGSLIFLGNEAGITTNPFGMGSIIECDAPRLFEPESMVDIIHEAGHHLLITSNFKDLKEKIEKFSLRNEDSTSMHNLLNDIFCDICLFLFGFLKSENFYSRHYWNNCYSNFKYKSISIENTSIDLCLKSLRYILVLFTISEQFDDEPLKGNFENLKRLLCKNYIYHKSLLRFQDDHTEESVMLKNLFDAFVESIEENGNIINDIKKTVLNNVTKCFSHCTDLHTLDIIFNDMQNDSINTYYEKLKKGTPIIYNMENYYSCIKHVSKLTFSFTYYLFNDVMKNLKGQYIHSDKSKLKFECFSNNIMRYKDFGGYFIAGDSFRGEHFKVQYAYLMSLWDVTIKEKSDLAERVFLNDFLHI